jgi:hypothetical protein
LCEANKTIDFFTGDFDRRALAFHLRETAIPRTTPFGDVAVELPFSRLTLYLHWMYFDCVVHDNLIRGAAKIGCRGAAVDARTAQFDVQADQTGAGHFGIFSLIKKESDMAGVQDIEPAQSPADAP